MKRLLKFEGHNILKCSFQPKPITNAEREGHSGVTLRKFNEERGEKRREKNVVKSSRRTIDPERIK